MKRTSSALILFVVLLVAFATGAALRRSVGTSHPADPTPPVREARAPSSPPEDRPPLDNATPDNPDAHLQQALELSKADDDPGALTAFLRWLKSVDAVAIEKQFDLWNEEEPPLDEALYDLALLRWAELDPDRLLEKLGTEESIQHAIYIAKLQKNPEAALKHCPQELLLLIRRFIAARHPVFDREGARSLGVSEEWYIGIWLRRGLDPLELLQSAELDPGLVTALFNFLANRPEGPNVAQLAKLLDDLEDPALLEAARTGLAKSIQGLRNPLQTLRMLHELDIPFPAKARGENGGLGGIGGSSVSPGKLYHTALSDHPEETVDWLMSLTPEERKFAIGRIYSSTLGGRTNTNGWLALMLRLPREELPTHARLGLYLGQEIEQNPQATLEWLEQIATRDHYSIEDEDLDRAILRQTANSLGIRLALIDLEAAIAQAQAIEHPELRSALLGGIVSRLVEFDLAKARELLPELTAEERAERTNEIFRREMRGEPIEDALQRLEALPNAQERHSIAFRVILDDALPAADRAAVLDRILPENPRLFGNAHLLVSNWATVAPTDAAAWLMNYSDHERFPKGVERLVEKWAQADLASAAEWVIALAPGAARDRGVELIAEQALHREPHSALEWAASISDPANRRRYLQQAVVAIDIQTTEPREAREAIDRLGIDEAERSELLQQLDD